jgi:hypothetical protein
MGEHHSRIESKCNLLDNEHEQLPVLDVHAIMSRVLVSSSSVQGLKHHKGALVCLVIRIWVELANDGFHNRYTNIEEQLSPAPTKWALRVLTTGTTDMMRDSFSVAARA